MMRSIEINENGSEFVISVDKINGSHLCVIKHKKLNFNDGCDRNSSVKLK